jgi:hypothetical protein
LAQWAGRQERFHAEAELPAERLPAPGLLSRFASDGYDVAHPTFGWRIEDDRSMTFNAAMAIGAAEGAQATAVSALAIARR